MEHTKRFALRLLTVGALLCLNSPVACTDTTPNAGDADPGDADPGDARGSRQVLVPSNDRVYPGWYTHNVAEEWEEYRATLGATPPVVFTFHDWNAAGTGSGRVELQTFDAPLEGNETMTVLEGARMIAEEGGILAIAWDALGYVGAEESYWSGALDLVLSFDSILNGSHDQYIRSCAREIKALGVPVMLSPFGEMDSIAWFMFGVSELEALSSVDDTRIHYGAPDAPDGPERVRDAYRHVVDIFREEQVRNVTWFMYASTGYMARGDKTDEEWALIDEVHPRHFYPGDDYVDWIGTSIYVENGGTLNEQLESGLEAWREVTDRPFFSPEFGLVAPSNQDRTSLINIIVDALPSSGIKLVGFADSELYSIYFDIPRLQDNAAEAEAWQTVFSDSRYTTELTFENRP